jgi:hypothetical protein
VVLRNGRLCTVPLMPTISITLPLPAGALSPNGNKGSWQKKAAATKHARETAKIHSLNLFHKHGTLPGMVTIHQTWYMGESGADRIHKIALKTVKQINLKLKERGLKPQRLPLPPSYHPRDIQNAIYATKSQVDGIVESGLLAGDTHRHVQWGRCRLFTTQKEHGGRSALVIELEWGNDPHYDGADPCEVEQ